MRYQEVKIRIAHALALSIIVNGFVAATARSVQHSERARIVPALEACN